VRFMRRTKRDAPHGSPRSFVGQLRPPQDDNSSWATSSTSLISNAKPNKPAVTVGASQKWKTGPTRLLSPDSHPPLMLEIGPELFGDSSEIRPYSRFLPRLAQLPHLIHSHGKGRLDSRVENSINRALHPPSCSVNLLINLFKSLSVLRNSSIFSTECSTVV
jgi:hypothetical protein